MTELPVVRHSPSSREIDIAASRASLRRLAEILEAADGSLSAHLVADASPFEQCLEAIEVEKRAGAAVVVSVDEGRRVLVVSGGLDALRVLASNVRDLADEGVDGEHLHVEYFPDHYYLDQASAPLVIQVRSSI